MPVSITHLRPGFLAQLRRRYLDSFGGRLIALSLGLSITLLWALVFFATAVQRQEFSEVLFDQQFASVRRLSADLNQKLLERTGILTAVGARLPPDLAPAVLDARLQDLVGLHSLFSAGIVVIGMDGRAIADYPVIPGRRGTYVGDRDYFRKAMETGAPFIDKPITGRTLNRPVLTIAAPILDAAGKPRAVMAGFTDLSAPNFLGLVFDQSISGKGEWFIFSPHDNIIVAATNTKHVMTSTPPRGANPMYDRFVEGFEGSGIAANSTGMSKIYSATRIPATNWMVMATLPTEVTFRPVTVMRNYLIATAALLTLLALFLTRWATRRVLVPLDEAGQAMRRMTRGDAPLAPLPVKNEDEIGGLIGNFNVLIENQHRSNAALADSEERFRMLVENAPHPILVHTGGHFTYVNAATLELFGAGSKHDLLGQPVLERVHPDMQAFARARIRCMEENRKSAPAVEHKLLRLDGAIVYAEISSVPFYYENAHSSLVFARDVTDRKLAEAALRESEERFHQLAALSSEWYWEQDENHRFTRITGWNADGVSKLPEQLLEQTRWAQPSSRNDTIWKEHRAILDARLPFTDLEYMLEDEDGNALWFSINGEPVFDRSGAFKGYRGTGKDITERKLAEDELRRSWARIRQLAAHQEEVKEEERKRIARDIHDELGQILLTMRFDALMLAKDAAGCDTRLQGKANLLLNHIDTAMKSVKAIINDLRPAVLDLGLLAAIEWHIREFQRSSSIDCVLEVHDDEFDRYLDEQCAAALFRVVQESMANVLRHAHARRIRISICTGIDRLDLIIADDGVGMQPDNRSKENSFGLVGIEERIHAFGGSFAVNSTPGKGTTLVVSVPIANHTDDRIRVG